MKTIKNIVKLNTHYLYTLKNSPGRNMALVFLFGQMEIHITQIINTQM